MNQHNFRPCLYPSLCDECDGIPAGVTVHLASGETFEYLEVLGIDLTVDEIIVRPAAGKPVSFRRDGIVYAGCSRVTPPTG